MSEYWVSRKTWTCKYCNLTINDDAPSRLQHENGMRHKGNVERALKEVYRKSENERREKQQAEIEMRRINKAAEASFAADLAAKQITTSVEPTSTPSDEPSSSKSPTASTPLPPGPPPKKPTEKGKEKDPFANYTTAESLGYSEDPEVIRKQEEEKRREQEGFAGDWEEVVSVSNERVDPGTQDARGRGADEDHLFLPPSERQKARDFKIEERAGSSLYHDEDEDDLGEIKVKKRIKIESSDDLIRREEEARRRMLPQWQSIRLEVKREDQAGSERRNGSSSADRDNSTSNGVDGSVSGSGAASVPAAQLKKEDEDEDEQKVKKEDVDGQERVERGSEPIHNTTAREEQKTAVPDDAEGTSEAGAGMFKKRKARGGGGAKKVRALA